MRLQPSKNSVLTALILTVVWAFSQIPVAVGSPRIKSLLACADRGVWNQAMVQTWLDQHALDLDKFTRDELVSGVKLLGDAKRETDCRLPNGFNQQWMSLVAPQLDKMEPSSLNCVLRTCFKLRVRPNSNFVEKWQNRAHQQIHRFSSKQLTACVFSIETLGIQIAQNFIQDLEEEITKKVSTFETQSVANLMYAYAISGRPPEDFWEPLKHQVQKIQNDLQVREGHQLYLFKKRFCGKFDFHSKTSEIIDQCLVFAKEIPSKSSKTQIEIYPILQMSYPNLQLERWFHQVASFVDYGTPEDQLAIQFDGPKHFLEYDGTLVQLPADGLMDRILRSDGVRVARISFLEWQQIYQQTHSLNPSQKKEKRAALLRTFCEEKFGL